METFVITKGEDAPDIKIGNSLSHTEIREQLNKRKLVSVRSIDDVVPIEGADAIEAVVIGGWKVVVKKNEFTKGDLCVYFEIDSFLPDGNPAWQFLVDKSPRMFEGVRGHKLRTIKLRGQLSQGFVMPIKAIPDIESKLEDLQFVMGRDDGKEEIKEFDFAEMLGIKKWEASLPACLQGQAAGLFPGFIRKTDQERCQNIPGEIFGYEETESVIGPLLDINVTRPAHGQLISGVSPTGTWTEEWSDDEPIGHMTHWRPIVVRPPKASREDKFEVTMKLDGSSMTAFVLGPNVVPGIEVTESRVGVCSRNLELKISDANKDNTFVRVLFDSSLNVALTDFFNRTGRSIADQGEMMGPANQGNREGFKDFMFFVFDIYDINAQKYLAPGERMAVFEELKAVAPLINHVPVLEMEAKLFDNLGIEDVEGLLKYAEGPSITNKVREGVVFKRLDGQFSFKAISNKFLIGEKD